MGERALLDLRGDYTQTGAGTFQTFIESTSRFGKLVSNGLASLAGTLEIVTGTESAPEDGQSFQVLGYANRVGTFDTVVGRLLPCPHAFGSQVDHGATAVTLIVRRALACS